MKPPSRLDDYRWLASDKGARWLDHVAQDERPLVVQATRLRRELSAERVHLVLQQVELRRRARSKFADAQRMFFTPLGLEQATDQDVAAYKASRFGQGDPLADLCCGIGGDLVALAGRGPVVGVERDPVAAVLAAANLRALASDPRRWAAAEVRVEDVAACSVSACAAWHLDPDRRPEGRRSTNIEHYQPGRPVIEGLLEQREDAAIKLAPAARAPEAWSSRAEFEWISRHRQCRQQIAWFGGRAERPGRRRATILHVDKSQDSPSVRTLVGTEGVRAPITAKVGRYVYDPDPAVLAARLVGTLAAEQGLSQMAAGAAYLTGDGPISDAALSCFEVTDVLPFDLRRLKRLLKTRGIGKLEIKKRGVSLDPEDLRRRLQLRADGSAVLLVAPVGHTVTAIVAQRSG